MRTLLLSAVAALALAACSPPAGKGPAAPGPGEGPASVACNELTPDTAHPVALEGEVAVAAAVTDLRGGRITPGTYDLASGNRIGGPVGWTGVRAIALDVREGEAGTIFHWAAAIPGGETERWTAGFIDTPGPHLTYTCGRTGGVDLAFTAEPNGLRLRIPEESGAGSLYLVFVRRS